MYIPSGGWACGLGSSTAFTTPRGLSNPAIISPSHLAGIAWSFATTRLERRGSAPGLHSDNSRSVKRSVWHPISTDAS
jgi:hypothetical protein